MNCGNLTGRSGSGAPGPNMLWNPNSMAFPFLWNPGRRLCKRVDTRRWDYWRGCNRKYSDNPHRARSVLRPIPFWRYVGKYTCRTILSCVFVKCRENREKPLQKSAKCGSGFPSSKDSRITAGVYWTSSYLTSADHWRIG